VPAVHYGDMHIETRCTVPAVHYGDMHIETRCTVPAVHYAMDMSEFAVGFE